MKASIARATRPEVVGGIGGFSGLFDLTPFTRLRQPLLASATDGVGTKVDVARRMDVHDTIGIDLVAMVLDDLVVCGAEPLFMTDYIADRQGRTPSRSRHRVRHRRRAAASPARRSSVARPPSTPACSTPTSTTSPVRVPASSTPTTCSVPSASRPVTS